MKLHVIERISLMKILPKEASYSNFKIIIELKSALSFTEKEHQEFGIVESKGTLSWKNSKEVDIPIGKIATDIICTALKGKDKEGKLDEILFNLYNKFIDPKS